MKINNNPDKYIKREALLSGHNLQYQEKLDRLNIKPTVNFLEENIDSNGYSILNKKE
jgi:hypothetical protein